MLTGRLILAILLITPMVSFSIEPNLQNVRHNPFPVQAPYAGIYSHAVETRGNGRYLHISGQLGFTEHGLLPESFDAQATQAITNTKRILLSANMILSNVIQMRFLITDRSQIDDLVKVRVTMLNGLAPAVTTHVVGGLLIDEWLIEVEAIAFASDRSDVQ